MRHEKRHLMRRLLLIMLTLTPRKGRRTIQMLFEYFISKINDSMFVTSLFHIYLQGEILFDVKIGFGEDFY